MNDETTVYKYVLYLNFSNEFLSSYEAYADEI